MVVIIIVAIMVTVVMRSFWRAKEILKGGKDRKANSQTIVDTRSSDIANRKIFTKDEGEYVEYEED